MPSGNLSLMADENSLLGTWKLRSYTVTKTTGEQLAPYGESPTGYLSYAPDGRMQVIGVANDRSALAGPGPSDKERLALYDTMFAYAGTFSVEGDKVIHHVDVSWNETWTGTNQIRMFEVRGSVLTVTTRIADPESGVDSYYVLAWEKIAGPR